MNNFENEAEQAERWISSKEGVDFLRQLAKNTEERRKEMFKDSRISVKSLKTPMTF